MTDIPEDVMKAAEYCWRGLRAVSDLTVTRKEAELAVIARAILADRQRPLKRRERVALIIESDADLL